MNMTRLSTEDIKHISLQYLSLYDLEFQRKTGKSLREFLEYLADKKINTDALKIAVVPITAGKGIIKGFSEAVCLILRYLGCKAFVTLNTDVAGFFEAFKNNVDLIFAADDLVFSAFNLKKRRAIDNSYATGYAYAAALELCAGGLQSKEVMVIGVGRVGSAALEYLISKGAIVTIFDKDAEKIKLTLEKHPYVKVVNSIDEVLPEIELIVLTAPSSELIKEHHVSRNTIIACPAMPLPLNKEVILKIRSLIHDPLQLGVISMLALAY